MTTMPSHPIRPNPLHFTADPEGAHTLRLTLHGDLDYDQAELLLDVVREELAERPELRTLRLDCAELAAVDSMGLSVLLMVHRVTTAADVRLHLDGRTPALERLLQITGTLDHFTGRGAEQISETS
ncbi:sulfate transporter [Streptomyces spiroverticillatus]|uniref:Sulfate transporter n=1 Tax=Streptomyces finlayi TaxID=67296 RepID=A0A918X232_9ACTN|nr:STAS domain-containing protein [Streptomyces finlayi]GHA22455.1 sulfate transporter [Streptomyces spiroverticillatus]GHD04410.1 sulfate transporter [Streptomyces finlayi]